MVVATELQPLVVINLGLPTSPEVVVATELQPLTVPNLGPPTVKRRRRRRLSHSHLRPLVRLVRRHHYRQRPTHHNGKNDLR